MEREIIEEKLRKLGIEKGIVTSTGSGSTSVLAHGPPEIIAPHARAASVRLVSYFFYLQTSP